MSQQNSLPPKMMAFYDHLEELRTRVIRCLWVFLAGFGACYPVSDYLLAILRRPLFAALPPEQQKLYFTHLFENFMTHLKISGYGALFFLSPYFFYELWAFIAPGLYPKERKYILPFLAAASGFFIGGAAFAYFVLFPVGFKYFVTYGGPSDVALLTMDSYYGTCLKLMLLFGIAFELPVLIVFLGFLGVLDAQTLRAQRRTAVIGISVLSAIAAPPDAVSMLLLGAPLVLLYEGAIWVVQWLGARRTPPAGDSGAAPEDPGPSAFVGRSKP